MSDYDEMFNHNTKFYRDTTDEQQCQLAPSSGLLLSNLWKSFTDPERRDFQAAEREDLVILASTIFN